MPSIGWPTFLAVYAIAVGLGVLSHVPAGLGVFETVIVASLGNAVNVDAVLGSLENACGMLRRRLSAQIQTELRS